MLTIRPISAKLKRDTEVFGKMDPYVVFILGDQRSKTRTNYHGGKTPKWNDEPFSFFVNKEVDLKIEVWDEDNLYDDLVGTATVYVDDIRKKGIY